MGHRGCTTTTTVNLMDRDKVTQQLFLLLFFLVFLPDKIVHRDNFTYS